MIIVSFGHFSPNFYRIKQLLGVISDAILKQTYHKSLQFWKSSLQFQAQCLKKIKTNNDSSWLYICVMKSIVILYNQNKVYKWIGGRGRFKTNDDT